MAEYMTKAWAREIINTEKEASSTMYFDGSIDFDSMYEMFRYQYRFGHHETMLILASLVNAGCKFR